jgi:hypothetical protein
MVLISVLLEAVRRDMLLLKAAVDHVETVILTLKL